MASTVVLIPDASTDKLPRPRRQVPLSLRIFVATLVVLGAVESWNTVRAYKERPAIHEIERLGGYVLTDSGYPVIGGPRAWMRERLDLPAGWVWRFDLNYSGATDAPLSNLECFSELHGLWLNGTSVTDAGLVHVARLKSLTGLWLGETRVTDAGLEHLRGLPDLTSLLLDNTRISDAGLPCLKWMANLRVLYIRETRVTDAGIEDLQRARPELEIWTSWDRAR